jgi:hypothetical protein
MLATSVLVQISLALLGIILLPVLFLLLFLYIATWIRGYYILRGKAFSPFESQVVCWSWLVASAPFLIGDIVSTGCLQIFALTSPVLNLVCASLAKPQKHRLTGKRMSRFNYELAAKFIVPGMLVVFIVEYAFNRDALTWDHIGKNYLLGPITLYYFFKTRDKLFRKAAIEETLQDNSQPCALYIRSFKQDCDPFFVGSFYSKDIAAQLDPNLYLHKEGGPPIKGITFQQYFSQQISTRVGPLIGLGNPEDYVPFEGMTASYYADENWEKNFIGWAKRAKCIITTPANTKGLLFELQFIRQNNLQTLFFIFTKPVRPKGIDHLIMVIMQWGRNVRAIRWEQYAEELRKLGFCVQKELPQPGTVITFNERCEQITVIEKALTPADYIDAVTNHLNLLTRDFT